ncbi:MAG: helix-turn-helix domain-containing protein [Oscillospiraceae bacterium]|nr:helix-turn-helix domain-containing protein [Oscillospiraceae bacterium]
MIGLRLKKLRQEKEIKQKDLAAVIGVQETAVSRYETDKDDPSDKIKTEIAKYFNISLDYLLGVIDEPVPYYNHDIFLKLPDGMRQEERILLSEFIGYIVYRRDKSSDA